MSGATEMDEETRKSIIQGAFPRSSMKRETMCRRLEILRHAVLLADLDNIQMTLNDFLMDARSLHDVIGNEGKAIDGFTPWWKERKTKLASAPLLHWAHEARVGDFHHGVPSIEVVSYQMKGGEGRFDPEPGSAPDVQLVMHGGGAFWVTAMGTPNERIMRAHPTGTVQVAMHMYIGGLSLDEGTPRSVDDLPKLCEEIARKNRELLHEVKVTFGLPSTTRPSA